MREIERYYDTQILELPESFVADSWVFIKSDSLF
jgi:hypothetical protein